MNMFTKCCHSWLSNSTRHYAIIWSWDSRGSQIKYPIRVTHKMD